MNALILAAGLGTRLGSLTADKPKALVNVAGRPMLEHQIRKLRGAGFDRIIVNVHHFAVQVKDFLSQSRYSDITVSDESDMLLDTGGGIRKAFHIVSDDSPLLVHNVDIFSDTDLRMLYLTHVNSGADVTLLTASRTTSRYFYFDDAMRLRGWGNGNTGETRSPFSGFDKDRCRPLAFQGIHVLSRSALPLLDKVEEKRFSITDFYVNCASQLRLKAIDGSGADWVDAGKPETLQKAGQIVSKTYNAE